MRYYVLLLLALLPCTVHAAEPPSCGTTIADHLQIARQSLTANTPQADHVTLACLTDAMAKLDTGSITATRRDGQRIIAVPVSNLPVKPK